MAAPQPGLIPPPNQSGIALPPLPHNPPIYGDIAYAVDYVNQLSWSRTRRSESYVLAPHVSDSALDNQGNPRPATDDEVGRAEVYKAVLTFAVAPQAFAPAWLQAFQAHIDNQFHALNANTVDQLSRSRTGKSESYVLAPHVIDSALDLQNNRATAEEVGQAEAYKAALTFAVAPAAAPAWVQALQAHIDNQFDALNIRIATEIQQLRVEQSILSENSRAGNFGPLYDPTVLGQWVLLAAPNPTCRSDLLTFDREWIVIL